MKTLICFAAVAVALLGLGDVATAQCSSGAAFSAGGFAGGGGGGVFIAQSKPAGLLGRRQKTTQTLIIPIGRQVAQPVCPPCDDDDDDVQVELLRTIARQIVEQKRAEDERETRELLKLLVQLLAEKREITLPIEPGAGAGALRLR